MQPNGKWQEVERRLMGMKLQSITISPLQKFKLRATWLTNDNKQQHTDFGARGYSDYTLHKDQERRRRYRIRHAKDHINDPLTAGALSWHLLWGPSSDLQRNIKSFRTRFRV